MHVAAARRDYNHTLTLLAAGADLCAENAVGDNPLHVACRLAVYPQIRYVLPRAPPEALLARNAQGNTPLHLALALSVCKEQCELAQPPPGVARAYLLVCYDDKEVKCQWQAEGPDGQQSTQKRSTRPSSRAQLVKTALAATPSSVLRATNAHGDTPLHVAARGRAVQEGDHVARSRWSANVFAVLLEHDVNVAAVNKQGDTALHLACRNASDAATVSALLNATGGQAALSTANTHGDTPLHDAARSSFSPEAVEELLRNGADIQRPNARGETPLEVAQRAGHHRVARFLKDVMINRSISASKRQAFDDWLEVSSALPAMSVRGGLPRRLEGDSVPDGRQMQPVVEEECTQTFVHQTGNVRDQFNHDQVQNWGGYLHSNNMPSVPFRNGSYLSNNQIDYQNFMSGNFEHGRNNSFDSSMYTQENGVMLHNSEDAQMLPRGVPDVFHLQFHPPTPPHHWVSSLPQAGVSEMSPDMMFAFQRSQNDQFLHSGGFGQRNLRNRNI